MDQGTPLSTRDKSDMTPLHWIAFHGSKSMLELAIAKGAEVDAVNYAMQTPLWFAVTKGHLESAISLIDAGASVQTSDESKRTMMHLAMQYGGGFGQCDDSLALLKHLIKHKADVNALDREKRAPLHWAVGKNALPCVQELIGAKADVNVKDWSAHSPLHWAMPLDAVESVSALLKAGAKVDAVDRDRRTPLHWASEKTAERCMRALLEEGGAEVDTVDWGGYSALHSAARCGSLSCIAILLAKGANPQLTANNGETPVDLAEDADVLKALAPPPEPEEPTMKRKRTLSTNSAAIEASIPEAADKFYKVRRTAFTACGGVRGDGCVRGAPLRSFYPWPHCTATVARGDGGGFGSKRARLAYAEGGMTHRRPACGGRRGERVGGGSGTRGWETRERGRSRPLVAAQGVRYQRLSCPCLTGCR